MLSAYAKQRHRSALLQCRLISIDNINSLLSKWKISRTCWADFLAEGLRRRDKVFLICFPMDYRDFSVKSKVIIHCFKQWDYDFRFSLFVNSFKHR